MFCPGDEAPAAPGNSTLPHLLPAATGSREETVSNQPRGRADGDSRWGCSEQDAQLNRRLTAGRLTGGKFCSSLSPLHRYHNHP